MNYGALVRTLVHQFFRRDVIAFCPECYFTGHEADLLFVTRHCYLIDVEIKTSRSDLKRDAAKQKWWEHHWGHAWGEPQPPPTQRTHPPRVWKHYMALPMSIWDVGLLPAMPSPASGILLIEDARGGPRVHCQRRAAPCKLPYKLQPHEVFDVARLASLRMLEAKTQFEVAQEEQRRYAEETNRLHDALDKALGPGKGATIRWPTHIASSNTTVTPNGDGTITLGEDHESV